MCCSFTSKVKFDAYTFLMSPRPYYSKCCLLSYDSPFGGNFACCTCPLLAIRTHFNVDRYDQAPSHLFRRTTLSASVRSGRSISRQLWLVCRDWWSFTESILAFFLICCNLHAQQIFPCTRWPSRSTLLLNFAKFFIMLMYKPAVESELTAM